MKSTCCDKQVMVSSKELEYKDGGEMPSNESSEMALRAHSLSLERVKTNHFEIKGENQASNGNFSAVL